MSPDRRTPRSGRPYALRHGAYAADIAGIGASLRRLTHEGRDLVVPFAADEIRPGFRGATLAPWPNRVVDGRYVFAGSEHQLALSEPDRGHALHGLVAWQEFEPVEVRDDHLRLRAALPAQFGYPHQVEVEVGFTLDDDGLSTTVTGRNAGDTSAPWGTGPHPYLVAGPGSVDDWVLELPAARVLTVTPDRLIPAGLAAVATEEGGRYDFRLARPIGETFIDHAYTDLARTPEGLTSVRVSDRTGRGVTMTWDRSCPWVQIHTADRPAPEPSRIGLAVEPMTCAPDAFNSGLGLITLLPGSSHSASWRLAALAG